MSKENTRNSFGHTRSIIGEGTRKFEEGSDAMGELFQQIFDLKWNRYVKRIIMKGWRLLLCHLQWYCKQRENWEVVGRREEEGKPVLQDTSGNSNQRTQADTWKPPRGSSSKDNQILSKQIFDKPWGEARKYWLWWGINHWNRSGPCELQGHKTSDPKEAMDQPSSDGYGHQKNCNHYPMGQI